MPARTRPDSRKLKDRCTGDSEEVFPSAACTSAARAAGRGKALQAMALTPVSLTGGPARMSRLLDRSCRAERTLGSEPAGGRRRLIPVSFHARLDPGTI